VLDGFGNGAIVPALPREHWEGRRNPLSPNDRSAGNSRGHNFGFLQLFGFKNITEWALCGQGGTGVHNGPRPQGILCPAVPGPKKNLQVVAMLLLCTSPLDGSWTDMPNPTRVCFLSHQKNVQTPSKEKSFRLPEPSRLLSLVRSSGYDQEKPFFTNRASQRALLSKFVPASVISNGMGTHLPAKKRASSRERTIACGSDCPAYSECIPGTGSVKQNRQLASDLINTG